MANPSRYLFIGSQIAKVTAKTAAKNVDKVDDVAKAAEVVGKKAASAKKGLSGVGAKEHKISQKSLRENYNDSIYKDNASEYLTDGDRYENFFTKSAKEVFGEGTTHTPIPNKTIEIGSPKHSPIESVNNQSIVQKELPNPIDFQLLRKSDKVEETNRLLRSSEAQKGLYKKYYGHDK